MTVIIRALASAALDAQARDPNDRMVLPMSTLIASEEWHLEAAWDGLEIGDVQVYRRKPGTTEWVWWGGVPRGKIVTYFWADDFPKPSCLKKTDAERKEEPLQAGEGSSKVAAAGKVAR